MRPKVLSAVIDANQIERWFDDAHKKAPGISIFSFAPYSFKTVTEDGVEYQRACSYMLVYMEVWPQGHPMIEKPIIQVPNAGVRKQ